MYEIVSHSTIYQNTLLINTYQIYQNTSSNPIFKNPVLKPLPNAFYSFSQISHQFALLILSVN